MKILFLMLAFLSANFSEAQTQDFNVDELIQSMGIDNQLEVAKQHVLQQTLPKNHIAVEKEFENYTAAYIASVKDHYLTKYTPDEIQELLTFYNSALGNKIKINSLEYEHIVHESMGKWFDKSVTILMNINTGKYSGN